MSWAAHKSTCPIRMNRANLNIYREFCHCISQGSIEHVIRLTPEDVLQSILPPIKCSGSDARGVWPIHKLISSSAPNCIQGNSHNQLYFKNTHLLLKSGASTYAKVYINTGTTSETMHCGNISCWYPKLGGKLNQNSDILLWNELRGTTSIP